MATYYDLTHGILTQIEPFLENKIVGYTRESRGNNDNKYVVKFENNPDLYVMSICHFTSNFNKELLVARVNFFSTLSDIIYKQKSIVQQTHPFPKFLNFKDSKNKSPYIEVVDGSENFLITINEFVKDTSGSNRNIQEKIDEDKKFITPSLVYRAGLYLGIVHKYSLANSDFLPKDFKVDVLKNISLQLEKNRNGIIKYNGGKMCELFDNQLFKLGSLKSYLQKPPRDHCCWCLLDFYPVNTIDSKNGMCFVDFGTAGITSYLLDLGMSIDAWCTKNNSPDMALVKQFLTGYFKNSSLNNVKPDLLYLLIRLSILKWGVNRAVNKINPPRDYNPLDPNQNILKLANWEKNKQKFQSILNFLLTQVAPIE